MVSDTFKKRFSLKFFSARKTHSGCELLFGNMQQDAKAALGIEFSKNKGMMRGFSIFVRKKSTSKPDKILTSFGISSIQGKTKIHFRRRKGIGA